MQKPAITSIVYLAIDDLLEFLKYGNLGKIKFHESTSISDGTHRIGKILTGVEDDQKGSRY